MARNKVKINGINNEIAKIMAEYSRDVEVDLTLAKTTIAKQTAQNLRETSPKGVTGSYAKGWTVSDINGKQVVHNKTDYRLTHLLENGHAKVNGGRVDGIPHIRPAEEKAINDFENAVKEALG